MGDQIIYLEKYIENSAVMPPELARILNTIKDLDERSEEMAYQIQDSFQALMAAPAGQPRKGSTEVADLRARLHADQTLLIQWAEEKLQLASTGHDLVSQQLTMLEDDIDALTRELEGPLGGLVDEFDMPMEEPSTRRGGRSLAYAPSVDVLAPMPSLDIRPTTGRKAAVSLSREPSGFGSEGGYGTGSEAALGWDPTPPPATNNKRAVASQKRQGPGPAATAATAAAMQAQPAAPAVQQPPAQPEGYQSKRRAAQAAVAATAAAVAALEDDEFGAGAPIAAQVPPTGFQHAARQPQAPGRLLTYQDIGEQLVGRKAEVFWPDENVWYVVEIKSVDPVTRQAAIIYSTGESEALNLDDICRDGHMSLMAL